MKDSENTSGMLMVVIFSVSMVLLLFVLYFIVRNILIVILCYFIDQRKKVALIDRGRGTSFFPVKHDKLPPSYIQDAKNFSVVKPLNSGEARASPASPVPRPLLIEIKEKDSATTKSRYKQA